MSMILEGGEPFFMPGNQIGCLLIHGFTGAPKEMRWLGDHLANEGTLCWDHAYSGMPPNNGI